MAAERLPASISDQVLRRIRSEYLEMPGLCLTLKQAQRLWGLDEETCREAMQLLVDTKFLRMASPQAPGEVRSENDGGCPAGWNRRGLKPPVTRAPAAPRTAS